MLASDLKVIWSMVRGAGSAAEQGERMNRLYRHQAEGYDRFREGFLHGRRDLIERLEVPEGGHVVELGCGTGRNLEFFGRRLGTFGLVTLVDLCRPLLDVARRRKEGRGWPRVEVVEADATKWRPEDGRPVDCVYLSYSLTMIPDWFRALENAVAMLAPGGSLGVVDFTVSRKFPDNGGVVHRPLARAFWRWWFAHDNVFLNPDHLPFLESVTGRIHRSERFGKVPYLPFLRAPYFIYIGRKRP